MLLETDHILPSLKLPDLIHSNKRNEKLNSGRWKPNEHDKFLEAIIIYGNDWKLVQKCIKSRSSTQARSHAQKFLLKLRKKLKIEPDSSNKLSKDSIDKIVKEIIETSCIRNSTVIDRDKLVKLIMGFSNLLVGKVSSPLILNDIGMNNNSYFNQDSYFDNNYPTGNGFFKYDNGENGRKVFNIEKVFKGERKHLLSLSNAESLLQSNHFLIEKTKKLDSGQFSNNNDLNKGNFQINQINNQSDLIKYLFQAPQNQDPANPNKNFINIISINICNKNEGESSIVPANSFANALFNNSVASEITSSHSPIIKKAGITSTVNLPAFEKHVNSTGNPSKPVINNKDNNVSKNNEIKSDVNCKSINKTAISTPSSNNFERDFYENSSSPNYFNQSKSEDDEYDKFFDWN